MLCLCVSPYRYRFVTVVAVLSENIPFSLGLHMISFFISVFIFVILDSRYFYFCCFCFCSILFLPLGWKPQNPSVLKSGFLVVILFPQFTFLWISFKYIYPPNWINGPHPFRNCFFNERYNHEYFVFNISNHPSHNDSTVALLWIITLCVSHSVVSDSLWPHGL